MANIPSKAMRYGNLGSLVTTPYFDIIVTGVSLHFHDKNVSARIFFDYTFKREHMPLRVFLFHRPPICEGILEGEVSAFFPNAPRLLALNQWRVIFCAEEEVSVKLSINEIYQ